MVYNQNRKVNKNVIKDVIGIGNDIYDVVERLIELGENSVLPIIVKKHGKNSGLQIFEQVGKNLSKQNFDSVQRLIDNVFYVEFGDNKGVYIVDQFKELFLAPQEYDEMLKIDDAFNQMLESSAYKKHETTNIMQKQPGQDS